MKVFFVCTGNTCRSPMAEAILKQKGLENIKVKSAGIYAMDGAEMSFNAQEILNEHDIPHQHFSKQITHEDVEWADVILTMTHAHKQAILNEFEQSYGKIYTLTEFAEQSNLGDVMDPYGGSLQVYRYTFEQLNQLIDQSIDRLREGEV